jgi:agmatine deiminase
MTQSTPPTNEPPRDHGYAMPPEWAPHRGTWLSWPHNAETWPDELEEVESVMADAAAVISESEHVFVNVLDADHESHVRGLFDRAAASSNVSFHRIPTNDAWIRDHGAIFVRRTDGAIAATSWGFNSWGEKYPPFDLDDRVPEQMAEALGVPTFNGGMILEGGSIEVSGDGVLLTTEACLLNPNRNPHFSREEIEEKLRSMLGVREIVWLGDGIVGDDTDGHIDDITRFANNETIVTVVEKDRSDENYEPLSENLERLRLLRTPAGLPYRIVELPMPRPVIVKGERMPASYANFYVANGAILLPVFGDPSDDEAGRILGNCFPGRRIVPINCRELIWGLGAFHCLTQQVPA